MSSTHSNEAEAKLEKRETVGFGESFRFYAGYFKPYRTRVAWAIFWHIIETTPHLAFPIITMFIVDYLIPARDKTGVFSMLLVIAVFLGIISFFYTAYRAAFAGTLVKVSRELRNQVVRRLQMLSLSYHDHNHTGRYYSKIITDVERCENFATMFMQQVFGILGLMFMSCTVLALVNWRIMLIMLALIPAFQTIRWIFKRRMRLSRKSERLAREGLSATVNNFLQASLLARMHGHEEFENRKVDNSNAIMSEKSVDAAMDVASFTVVNTSCTVFFHFLVIAFSASAVIDGTITYGEMLLFASYSWTIVSGMQQILNLYPQTTIFCESVTSIKEVLEAPDVEYNQGKRKVEHVKGGVAFDNVSFTYPKTTEKILANITVDIAPGMSVGLVGKSGSGKSTFINLLLGLYRTKEGVISIDHMPIDSLDMRTVRHHIGVVNQDPVLFSGTIFDNIVHAYHDVPMEDVVDAAKKANAHDFICRLPNGYDSEVGEHGTLLSGGQKQRIALARSILRNPSILILDEATSSLDSESEKLVQDAISRLDKKITKIIIAHRLSTVRDVDRILVFKNGSIVESGTHDELVPQNGEYANLLMYQSLKDTPVLAESK